MKSLGQMSPNTSDRSPLWPLTNVPNGQSWSTHAATWLTLHVGQEHPQSLHHSVGCATLPAFAAEPLEQKVDEVASPCMHPLQVVVQLLRRMLCGVKCSPRQRQLSEWPPCRGTRMVAPWRTRFVASWAACRQWWGRVALSPGPATAWPPHW